MQSMQLSDRRPSPSITSAVSMCQDIRPDSTACMSAPLVTSISTNLLHVDPQERTHQLLLDDKDIGALALDIGDDQLNATSILEVRDVGTDQAPFDLQAKRDLLRQVGNLARLGQCRQLCAILRLGQARVALLVARAGAARIKAQPRWFQKAVLLNGVIATRVPAPTDRLRVVLVTHRI